MQEEEIYDIIHDYVHHAISEQEFVRITRKHPETDWNGLVKEEKLMQSMFQAKAYDVLGDKIHADIDKIERSRKVKKYTVAGAALLALLGGGVYIMSTPTKSSKEGSEPERKEQQFVPTEKEVVLDTISNQKESPQVMVKKEKVVPSTLEPEEDKSQEETTQKDTLQNKAIPQDTLVPQVPVSSPETEEKNKAQDRQVEEIEVKEPVIEQPENILIKEKENESEEKAKLKSVNYIINPSMQDFLEIEGKDNSITLVVKNLRGELVFQKVFSSFETILWEGRDENGKYSPVGLYIYQLEKEGETIQFGQITVTE